MNFSIAPLTKSRRFLRMALMGPTGSGKTYTALTIARGLTDGKIAVIDTERQSAGLYAEELNADGRIDVISELPDYTPVTYARALEFLAKEGYAVVIIDSLSHAWQGTKDEVDRVAKKSTSGNSWAAWREVTPQHNQLVDTMLSFPGHVIATLRVKTDWVTEVVNGKSVPKKIGLAPEQKDGIEYEFDFAAMMDEENNFVVTKTRASQFRGLVENRPGMALAERLRAWSESGTGEDGTVKLTDPFKAIKAFALSNMENDQLVGILKERGYSKSDWKDIVLEAFNSGVRGVDALRAYVGNLPVKEVPVKPADGSSDSSATVETANAPSAQPPSTPTVQSTNDHLSLMKDAAPGMVRSLAEVLKGHGVAEDEFLLAAWQAGCRNPDAVMEWLVEWSKEREDIPQWNLKRSETNLFTSYCNSNNLDGGAILKDAWAQGARNYVDLMTYAKAQVQQLAEVAAG